MSLAQSVPEFVQVAGAVCILVAFATLHGLRKRRKKAKYDAARARYAADVAANKERIIAERRAEQAREREQEQAEAHARWEAQEKARAKAEKLAEEDRQKAETARRLARMKQLEDDLHRRFWTFVYAKYLEPPDTIPNAIISEFMTHYTLNTPAEAGLLRSSGDGLVIRCLACTAWFPARIAP